MEGVNRVTPVVMRRDQCLNVVCDHSGKFLRLEETMPPLINYARLPEVSFAAEKALRDREWAAIEVQG